MTELEIINMAMENLQKQTHILGKWKAVAHKDFDGELALELEEKGYEKFENATM